MTFTKELKPNPSLQDYQSHVKDMMEAFGFSEQTIPQIFMLLMEECGEMAKAARKATGMRTASDSEKFNMENEAADVFIYLLNICNRFDIDLEKAFREKDAANKKRTWN